MKYSAEAMSNRRKNLKLCSINICGWSERSKITLDKYVNTEKFDIVAVQETNTDDQEKLGLTNMKVLSDSNKSRNKGTALYVNKNLAFSRLKELNEISKDIDASWGLGVINNKRYILGSVYVKLNHSNAIEEVIQMLNKAYSLIKKLRAVGIILTGDFNARHESWGDARSNIYGNKLVEKLDTSRFSITTAGTNFPSSKWFQFH